MTATIGTSTNFNTTANVLNAINADSLTTVKLLDALNIPLEVPRIKVIIYNSGKRTLWVKFQPAATDNDKKGIPIQAGETKVVMEGSDIYTGEISAIYDSGTFDDVYVTWY